MLLDCLRDTCTLLGLFFLVLGFCYGWDNNTLWQFSVKKKALICVPMVGICGSTRALMVYYGTGGKCVQGGVFACWYSPESVMGCGAIFALAMVGAILFYLAERASLMHKARRKVSAFLNRCSRDNVLHAAYENTTNWFRKKHIQYDTGSPDFDINWLAGHAIRGKDVYIAFKCPPNEIMQRLREYNLKALHDCHDFNEMPLPPKDFDRRMQPFGGSVVLFYYQAECARVGG